jgi:hypothetical protein
MNFDVGHIAIDLREGVNISSTRLPAIGRVFHGKSPEAAKALVPLLFAVCGQAQQAACSMALAAAAGKHSAGKLQGELVAMEAIREHLMRIAVDWAGVVACPIPPSTLRRIHGLVAMAKSDIKAAREEALSLVRELVADPDDVALHGEAFSEKGDTVAARLLEFIKHRDWQDLGVATISANSLLEPDREASCFTLVKDHPLISDIVLRHGEGLLPRLFARLVHIVMLMNSLSQGKFDSSAAEVSQPGLGIATVNTARGPLVHSVMLEHGVIEAYKILAPTDKNFTPFGPLSRSLAALVGECHDAVEVPARLLIEAYDPCVSYSLRVH